MTESENNDEKHIVADSKRRKIMFRIKNSFAAFGFFLALFVFAPSASYAQAAKPPSDVNVINTPSVNVTNTPNVNVTNAPDVKVTNTPKVLNANDLQPFQRTKSAVSSQAEAVQVDFTVPLDKRLVIEFASLRVSAGSGQEVSATIATLRAGAVEDQHQVVMNLQRTRININEAVFAGAQQMRMYVEPGMTVTFVGGRSTTDGSAVIGDLKITGTISGYLVDVQ